MKTLHDTYNTESEANTFVRVFNAVNGQGRRMSVYRAAPGVYQVWEHI